MSVPPSAAGAVKARTADGGSVSIGLPQTKNVPGAKAGRGTTVYPGAAPSTDLAVQATPEGGVRALAVLKDKTAPREQRYAIGLPDGTRLVKAGTGAVAAVGRDGKVLGAFAAPWAKGADGRELPTDYRIEGNVLVQSVQTTGSTAFPVVADPWYDPPRGKAGTPSSASPARARTGRSTELRAEPWPALRPSAPEP
ncbi:MULTISPECIES: hypothetical protein [unclassified Streptomyces]|uniref:hypothetical protein n=1 Tax=unclassified Streptomyces TaxID=2593676 RepID=UPI0013A6ACCD|nr:MULTISPECIES: hypothetical protein [unclassified Streptomyces]